MRFPIWAISQIHNWALIEEILKEESISIAGGQLHLKGKIIRIAHMGFISKSDLDAGFAAIEKRLARVKA